EKGNVGNKAKDDLQGYKIARVNDLVLNKMNAVIGSLGVSKYNGLVSPIYLVLYTANPNYLITYYSYLFQIKSVQKFLRKFAYGIMEIRESIDYLEFKKMFLPVPPLQEQKEIAEFLDSKCEKIQNYIEKKQKLITLLQEKKQALINEVVTKGLNPNIEFKNSGIAYLGLIPHHWEVARSGLIYKNISSGTTPQSDNDEYYKNGNIFWINSGDLNDSVLTNSKNKITQKAMMAYSALKISPKGSLIIAMYGATIGKVSILGIDACTNQACCVLCESKYLNTRFVFYYFIAKRQDLISMAYGGGQPNISQDIIKNFKIPLPPLQEQKQIANFLDEKCEKINSVIEKTKKQIELIKEYKNTLINEAVCGRIRVN
ncbi:restriction endonuclease subunit S, partial [Campylobacter upsaliensis]|nr:restriction endonuclease subunit S [Campylobacter upsaliensis]